MKDKGGDVAIAVGTGTSGAGGRVLISAGASSALNARAPEEPELVVPVLPGIPRAH